MQTRYAGKLSQADLNDVRRIVRPKMYWLRIVASGWYGVLLLCAITWATVAGIIGPTHPNWSGIGVIWLVIAGIVAWSFYSTRRSMAKEFSELNATLPDSQIIDSSGVRLELPGGATAFHPWSTFKGWREGQSVIVLDKQDRTFVMVPVGEISGIERESIRQFLYASIAPTAAAPATTR